VLAHERDFRRPRIAVLEFLLRNIVADKSPLAVGTRWLDPERIENGGMGIGDSLKANFLLENVIGRVIDREGINALAADDLIFVRLVASEIRLAVLENLAD
jgi:hypothetical protein